MPRFEKGSKEAQDWAKKMRESRGKDKKTVVIEKAVNLSKGGKVKDLIPESKEQPNVVYCPNCLAKGKKVVMTKRGEDTLVCNVCKMWVKAEND